MHSSIYYTYYSTYMDIVCLFGLQACQYVVKVCICYAVCVTITSTKKPHVFSST